jgi:hypothetical protein
MKKIVNGTVMDMSAEEIAELESIQITPDLFQISLKHLRLERNKLLADSDWEVIMAKEKGTNLSSAFKTWRQELRDITEGLTTVEEVEAVVFPEKP